MAKDYVPDELWVVQGGKAPKKVGSVGEGMRELSTRGGDATIIRAKDAGGRTRRTGKDAKETKASKTEDPKKAKGGK